MAEGLFKAQLAQAGQTGWTVGSAGTWTQDGVPATPEAVDALGQRGIDIGRHRSRRITAALLAQADLVLVMTAAHAEALRAEFPEARNRVHMLTAMAGSAYDIPDPVGKPLAWYMSTATELARVLERGFDRIVAEAQARAGSRAPST